MSVCHLLAQALYSHCLEPTFLNRNPISPWRATKWSCLLRELAPWPISPVCSPCTFGTIRTFQAGQYLLEQEVFLSSQRHPQRPNISRHVYSVLSPGRARSLQRSQYTKTGYFQFTYCILVLQRSLLWIGPLWMDRTQPAPPFSSGFSDPYQEYWRLNAPEFWQLIIALPLSNSQNELGECSEIKDRQRDYNSKKWHRVESIQIINE